MPNPMRGLAWSLRRDHLARCDPPRRLRRRECDRLWDRGRPAALVGDATWGYSVFSRGVVLEGHAVLATSSAVGGSTDEVTSNYLAGPSADRVKSQAHEQAMNAVRNSSRTGCGMRAGSAPPRSLGGRSRAD